VKGAALTAASCQVGCGHVTVNSVVGFHPVALTTSLGVIPMIVSSRRATAAVGRPSLEARHAKTLRAVRSNRQRYTRSASTKKVCRPPHALLKARRAYRLLIWGKARATAPTPTILDAFSTPYLSIAEPATPIPTPLSATSRGGL
jgi:hypothetical protein